MKRQEKSEKEEVKKDEEKENVKERSFALKEVKQNQQSSGVLDLRDIG